MAVPICPTCKSSLFETAEFTPQGYKHRLLSIHCSNCGSITAILDHHGMNARLDRLENLVESLKTKIDNLKL
jgi:RNase P subunit RPR2